jgi:hypothetical protein
MQRSGADKRRKKGEGTVLFWGFSKKRSSKKQPFHDAAK